MNRQGLSFTIVECKIWKINTTIIIQELLKRIGVNSPYVDVAISTGPALIEIEIIVSSEIVTKVLSEIILSLIKYK